MLQALSETWYRDDHPAGWLLAPAGLVVGALATLRRRLYRRGLLASHGVGAPVVVVGNLTVGGTGKTPLVLWLTDYLARAGWRPGIALRGYGALARHDIVTVSPRDDAARVGDEALLLARRSACPVVASPDRVRAARRLVEACGCDIVVCDDGLQHLRLRRDVEIVVIDGERRFGNRRCLPAGPLREPLSRLAEIELRVVNGGATTDTEVAMRLQAGDPVALDDATRRCALGEFRGRPVHAVAGIGNPARFFSLLRAEGLEVLPHAFPDHHRFVAGDLRFDDDLPLLMTEKDAVKCHAVARPGSWYLPVSAVLPESFGRRVLTTLEENGHGPQAA